MSLFGRFGAGLEEERRPTVEDIARIRIAAARACHAWTELDPTSLVQRGRYLVDADTDAVYTPYRGAAFARDGKIISNLTPLFFTVDDDTIRVLERYPQPWSQVLYARERIEQRAQAGR